jgi:heat shock protein HslJ
MTSRRATIGLVLAVAAATVLGACSSGSSLTGKTWQWTSATTSSPASQSVVPDPTAYTIEFKSDGTYAAKADCNQLTGSYTTTSSSGLTIASGPMTLAACGADSLSDVYVHSLLQASSYGISGSDLTITLADNGTMTFK